MADPYAAFSSPIAQGADGDPYASFSSPVDEAPPATALDRVGAVAAGFNRGVAATAGIPVDTMANIRDLGKAVVGSIYGLITSEGGKPLPQPKHIRMFDVDEDGNLIPSQSYPQTNIPDALQIRDRAEDIGSGANIAQNLDRAAVAIGGSPVTQAPRPDDKASRYLYAAGAGASSALLSPGRPVMPAVGGATGSVASQAAAENGADPSMQAAAGFAGAMVPGAARVSIAESARRLARGGEEGRQRVAQNVQTFKDAGTQPTVGQATESRVARATESLLTKAPGGAGRMVAKGEAQGQEIGSKIESLATQLSPKASGEQAGRAIQRGVSGSGGFVESFKAKSGSNYNELDKHVKATDTFDVSNTQAALQKLTTPIAGAEKTSGRLINSRIKAISDALTEDLAANNGVMPYRAVKELRTMIGNEMADAPLGGDVSRAQWKQVYSGLTKDMQAAATKAGPQAEAALARANAYHAAGMKRLEVLDNVVDKAGGPEAVFRAATSGAKEGATTLRAVMQSLPDEAKKTLSASVLRRMGRAKAGNQDEHGEKFSTETFLTNWNTMSPQARAVLFDRYGPAFRADMDSIAKVANNLREGSAVFRNPSGTSQAAGQTGAVVAFLTSLATGHPGGAAAVAAGAGGANISARVMTSPAAVKWLAQTTRASQSALPALINQAAQSSDPDLRDLAKLLKQRGQEQRKN